MALLPQWNVFKPGVVVGSIGLIILLITVFVWRKMENKTPIHLTGKIIFRGILGTAGVLMLGLGMVLAMVWSQMVFGIIIGIVGIILLLSLIPIIKGIN